MKKKKGKGRKLRVKKTRNPTMAFLVANNLNDKII